MLAAKLFGATRRIAANSLAHLFIIGNPFAKGTTAYDFLLCRRELLKVQTGFTAQLPDSSLEYNVKVLPDYPRALLRKVESSFNAHSVEFFAHAPADTPNVLNRNKGKQSPLAVNVRQIHYPARLPLPFLCGVVGEFSEKFCQQCQRQR